MQRLFAVKQASPARAMQQHMSSAQATVPPANDLHIERHLQIRLFNDGHTDIADAVAGIWHSADSPTLPFAFCSSYDPESISYGSVERGVLHETDAGGEVVAVHASNWFNRQHSCMYEQRSPKCLAPIPRSDHRMACAGPASAAGSVTEPSLSTIKRLFAMSGRRCAFPDCEVPAVLETGEIIGEICHIKARSPRGPRYDADQSEAERHGYDNLLVLCPTHHKIIDVQSVAYTVDVLQDMKSYAESQYARPQQASDAIFAKALLEKLRDVTIKDNSGNIAINSPGAIQAATIVLKNARSITSINPPPGTVGSDGDATRYVKHLIDRYNEFAKSEPSRSRAFSHAVVYKAIEREFGSSWKLISLDHFEDLCIFLQKRIAKTRIGKNNTAKGYPIFSQFREFISK